MKTARHFQLLTYTHMHSGWDIQDTIFICQGSQLSQKTWWIVSGITQEDGLQTFRLAFFLERAVNPVGILSSCPFQVRVKPPQDKGGSSYTDGPLLSPRPAPELWQQSCDRPWERAQGWASKELKMQLEGALSCPDDVKLIHWLHDRNHPSVTAFSGKGCICHYHQQSTVTPLRLSLEAGVPEPLEGGTTVEPALSTWTGEASKARWAVLFWYKQVPKSHVSWVTTVGRGVELSRTGAFGNKHNEEMAPRLGREEVVSGEKEVLHKHWREKK